MPLSPLPPTVQPGGNQKRPSWSRSLSSLHSNYTRNSETSKQSNLISARQSVLPFLLQGREDSGKREIFTDAAAMKDRIRAQACKREYDVRHFYHESGFAQRLARHDLFGNLALRAAGELRGKCQRDAEQRGLVESACEEYNTEPTLATAHPIFVAGDSAKLSYSAHQLVGRGMGKSIIREL
ncbi:unnamed protein product [Symbiodinium natans]|uniref:Uncharacterized protein n=1 Tax=Symbiodinium natans TaxID=878477 RepID=A0A812IEB1_9DINO|nr:unnamed protein product [Symbiodinium natans]